MPPQLHLRFRQSSFASYTSETARGDSGEHTLTISRPLAAGLRADLHQKTSFYAVLKELDLVDADWLDFLLDILAAQMVAHSAFLLSETLGSAQRLLVVAWRPRAPRRRPPPSLLPSAISHYPFAPAKFDWQAPRHNDSILLKDRHSRTYLMSIADGATDRSFEQMRQDVLNVMKKLTPKQEEALVKSLCGSIHWSAQRHLDAFERPLHTAADNKGHTTPGKDVGDSASAAAAAQMTTIVAFSRAKTTGLTETKRTESTAVQGATPSNRLTACQRHPRS